MSSAKLCVRCGERPEHVSKNGKLRSWCSPCLNKANYKTKANNPEKYLRQRQNRHLIKKYGITKDEYDLILTAQGGVCGSCGESDRGFANGSLHVDHDHKTGAVRGILCGHCNIVLGHVKDDSKRLKSLISYLERNQPS